MAINFPDSPSINDTITNNGITWKWDGTTWISEGVSTGYVLPNASGSTLGGIKVGSGLSVNGSGVLSTAGTGAWEVITSGSATNTHSFVITTNALTSTYEFYKLYFITGDGGHLLAIDVTTDGTNWASASGGTQYTCAWDGQYAGSEERGQKTNNTYGYIYGGEGTTSNQDFFDGEISFSGAHRTDRKHMFNCRFTYLESPNDSTGGIGMSNVMYQSTTAIQGIRLICQGENGGDATVARAAWSLLGMKVS